MNDVYTWSKKGIKFITTYLSYSHLVVVMIVIIIMIMIIIITITIIIIIIIIIIVIIIIIIVIIISNLLCVDLRKLCVDNENQWLHGFFS